ncbi:MAG: S41 family peptidase [Bacteroidota bacterium]
MKQRLFFLIGILWFSACEQETIPSPPTDPKSFPEIFDTFWVKMNSNYVFWDLDLTSWDEQYQKYKPIFEQLDINKRADVEKSVEYFTEMTKDIIDGHYYIQIKPKYLGNEPVINPALTRKQASSNYRPPHSYSAVAKTYLAEGYMSATTTNFGTHDRQLEVVCGRIHDDILYFYFSSCYLSGIYNSGASSGVEQVIDYYFNELINGATRGVIIDLRNNPGGDVVDLNFILGRFVQSPTTFGAARFKYDAGKLDLTPWIDTKISVNSNAARSDIQIVVLADGFTGSVAELMTSAIQSLPTGTFIGEKTYGATGVLTSQSLYNDGSFTVGDFMNVQAACSQFRTLDNRIVEGIGLTPDIEVKFDGGELNKNNDAMLEQAINKLEKK